MEDEDNGKHCLLKHGNTFLCNKFKLNQIPPQTDNKKYPRPGTMITLHKSPLLTMQTMLRHHYTPHKQMSVNERQHDLVSNITRFYYEARSNNDKPDT
jgi:hypothetical protein